MSISEIYKGMVGPIATPPDSRPAGKVGGGPGAASEFKSILDSQVNLSQHAETRIRSREIPWDAAMEKRISDGIKAAEAKGSRETLILAGDIAVIANVKSKTVVTAMSRDQLKERVFTNIDSAVLV